MLLNVRKSEKRLLTVYFHCVVDRFQISSIVFNGTTIPSIFRIKSSNRSSDLRETWAPLFRYTHTNIQICSDLVELSRWWRTSILPVKQEAPTGSSGTSRRTSASARCSASGNNWNRETFHFNTWSIRATLQATSTLTTVRAVWLRCKTVFWRRMFFSCHIKTPTHHT